MPKGEIIMAPGIVGIILVRAKRIDNEHIKSVTETKLNSGTCLHVSRIFLIKLSCKGIFNKPKAKFS